MQVLKLNWLLKPGKVGVNYAILLIKFFSILNYNMKYLVVN